jgi:hypothetical protein
LIPHQLHAQARLDLARDPGLVQTDDTLIGLADAHENDVRPPETIDRPRAPADEQFLLTMIGQQRPRRLPLTTTPPKKKPQITMGRTGERVRAPRDLIARENERLRRARFQTSRGGYRRQKASRCTEAFRMWPQVIRPPLSSDTASNGLKRISAPVPSLIEPSSCRVPST